MVLIIADTGNIVFFNEIWYDIVHNRTGGCMMRSICDIKGLDEVDDDEIIARYYNYSKVKRLLDSQEIWFTEAEIFSDNYERCIPRAFFNGMSESAADFYQKVNKAMNGVIGAYITCWNKFEYENYAMWKIYCQDGGICVVSTVKKLREQLNRKDIVFCEVKYVDFNSKAGGKSIAPFVFYADDKNPPHARVFELFKLKPYSYEKEIRGIIYKEKGKGNNGFGVKVSLKDMIDEIHISPFMKDDCAASLKNELKTVFKDSIIKDSLINEKS